MALLPASPQENVLNPLFYAAGAATGLASGLLEVITRLLLLGLQAASAYVMNRSARKGRSVIGGGQCCGHGRSSPHHQHQQERHAASAAPPAATAQDPGSPSPAPLATPLAAAGPAPPTADDAAAPAPAPAASSPSKQQEGVSGAASTPPPPPAEERSLTSGSAGDTTSGEAATTAPELDTAGPAAALPGTAAPSAEVTAGVSPRPASAPVSASVHAVGNGNAPNGQHELGSTIGVERVLAVPPSPTHGSQGAADTSSSSQPVAALSDTTTSISGDEERFCALVQESLQEYGKSTDLVVPTPPLVSEPQASEILVAGRSVIAATVQLHHGDDHDDAISEGGKSGITAFSFATANSVDPVTGAPMSRRLKTINAAAAPGQSVTQRLEEKRLSGRRKGAHQAKPR